MTLYCSREERSVFFPFAHAVALKNNLRCPEIAWQAGLLFELGQEIPWVGQGLPYLRQKGGSVRAITKDDAVKPRAQPFARIRFVCDDEGLRRRKERDFDSGACQFLRCKWRESRVVKGGGQGVGLDVIGQGAVGLQATDAAAQHPFLSQRDKSGAGLCKFLEWRRFLPRTGLTKVFGNALPGKPEEGGAKGVSGHALVPWR